MVKGPESPQSDAALVQQVLGGDRAAFGPLVSRYQGRLFGYLERRVGSASEAADLVQETFVKAFRNLGSYDRNRPFAPWIYRIARNNAVDYMRAQRVNPARPSIGSQQGEDHGDFLERVHDPSANPARDAQERAARVRIQQALQTLDSKYREPLSLFHFEGMQYDEIAAILRIPLGTVMTRLYRGRKKLIAELEDLV